MKFIWLIFSFILIEIVYTRTVDAKVKKKTFKRNVKKIYSNVQIPRFIIPNPEGDANPPTLVENDFSPEAITITKQTGNIKETELPGAFGEDDALRELFEESGSSEDSSGDHSNHAGKHQRVRPKHSIVAENHDNHAENAANFGSHLPAMEGGMNPSTAFASVDQNHKEITAGDDIRRKPLTKSTKKNKEKTINGVAEAKQILKLNTTKPIKIASLKNDSVQIEKKISTNDNNKVNKLIKTARLSIDDESGVDNNQDENEKTTSVYQQPKQSNETEIKSTTYDPNPSNVTAVPSFLNFTQIVVNYTVPQYNFTNYSYSSTPVITIQPNITSFNETEKPKQLKKPNQKANRNTKYKKLSAHQSDRELYNAIQSIQQEIKEVEQKASSQRKKMNKNETKNYHKIRHQVDNQMKKIQKDLRKFKKYKKKSTKKKGKMNEISDEMLLNSSYGGIGEPKGFECPWACMWACHSYCPKECCNNPYNCELICREVCSPTCNDKCCAPGTRRLPRLQLQFKSEAKTRQHQMDKWNGTNQDSLKLANNEQLDVLGGNNQTSLEMAYSKNLDIQNENNQTQSALGNIEESETLEKINQTGLVLGKTAQLEKLKKMNQTELADKLKVIETAQKYASQILGLPASCPLFCNRVCAPTLCPSECCHTSTSPLIELLYPPIKQLTNNANVQNITETPIAQSSTVTSPISNPSANANNQEYFTPDANAQQSSAMNAKDTVTQSYMNNTSKNQAIEAPLSHSNNNTAPISPNYNSYEQSSFESDSKAAIPDSQLQNEEVYQNEVKQQEYADYAQAPQNLDLDNRVATEVSNVQAFQNLVTPQPLLKPEVAAIPDPSQYQAEYPTYQSPPQSSYMENLNDNLIPQPKLEEVGDARDARLYGKLPACLSDNSCPGSNDSANDNNRDPDYCPPICRTSCIDQCPNECCTSHNIENQPDKTK